MGNGKNMAGLAAGIPPVMPAGNVAQGQPDYFTVILPYYDCNKIGEGLTDALGTTTPSTTPPIANTAIYRLNSIYDCKAYPGSNLEQPAFRDQWVTLFTHYRVLEAFVSVKYINTCTASDSNLQAAVLQVNGMINNKTAPDSNLTSRPDRFFADKHGWTHLLGPLGSEDDIFTWDYHYIPETLDFDVADEGDVSVWTPIGASPSLPVHNLYLNAGKLKAAGDGNVTDVSSTWTGAFEIRIKYKVQFRGAKYTLTEEEAAQDK